MKRLIIPLLLLSLLLLSACGAKDAAPDSDVATASDLYDLSIREKMFVSQVNDVYINAEDFLGKTIHLEGMFSSSYYEPTDSMFCMVFRYGPGCCGTDGTVGFEVVWDETAGISQPEEGAWIEVAGILQEYEEFGTTYLRLKLSELEVKAERGAETVTQ